MKIEEGNQLEKYWNDYWVSVLKREDCSRNNKRETFLAGLKQGLSINSVEEKMYTKEEVFWYSCRISQRL